MDDQRRAGQSLKHTATYRGSGQPSQVDGVSVTISDDPWLSLVSLDNRTHTSLITDTVAVGQCLMADACCVYVMHLIILCLAFFVLLVNYFDVIMSLLRLQCQIIG